MNPLSTNAKITYKIQSYDLPIKPLAHVKETSFNIIYCTQMQFYTKKIPLYPILIVLSF